MRNLFIVIAIRIELKKENTDWDIIERLTEIIGADTEIRELIFIKNKKGLLSDFQLSLFYQLKKLIK